MLATGCGVTVFEADRIELNLLHWTRPGEYIALPADRRSAGRRGLPCQNLKGGMRRELKQGYLRESERVLLN